MVEDNEELLALMLQVLSKNYHVFTAKNGKQAMNIIMKEKLDLVVSDVMMPIMDGIELTKQLKSDKSFWQLPIILLTAKNKEEDKTEAYAAGADAYITKPFKFEELEVRINALLANRKKMIEKIQAEVSLQTSTESETQTALHLSNPDQALLQLLRARGVLRSRIRRLVERSGIPSHIPVPACNWPQQAEESIYLSKLSKGIKGYGEIQVIFKNLVCGFLAHS